MDAIWNRAVELVHSEGYITQIPGQVLGKGRMVASASSSLPHMVTTGSKSDVIFKCDKNCPRYYAYNFCRHTVAVAEMHACLNKFIEQLKKQKTKTKSLSPDLPWFTIWSRGKGWKAQTKKETHIFKRLRFDSSR